MRLRPIKRPRVPVPSQCVVGACLAIGEGEGVVIAKGRSHIVCAMMAGSEVLGYQLFRWDTRREPTWQCLHDGWHLYRTAAERHFRRLAARGG